MFGLRKARGAGGAKPGATLKGSLFIVTYGRSGSTLLQSLLQTIPGAHIVGENYGALEGLYRSATRVQRTREKWGRNAHPANHPWYGASRLDPDRYEQRLVELFVEEVIQPPPGTRWQGFKEIRYPKLGEDFVPMLTFMRRTFPNAQFVFNTRDVAAVAKSAWWGKTPREQVEKVIARADAMFADYAAAHPDHAFLVRHEETVADPASLAPLFAHLGETLDLDRARAVLEVPLKH